MFHLDTIKFVGPDNASNMDAFYIAAGNGYDYETGEVMDFPRFTEFARSGYAESWLTSPDEDERSLAIAEYWAEARMDIGPEDEY